MTDTYAEISDGMSQSLFVMARDGDKGAIQLLFLRYRGWIHHLVRFYAEPADDIHEDLVSAGTEGFLKALSKYDPDRNVPFLGFADRWVRGAIRRHFFELRRTVHVGTSSLEKTGVSGLPTCVSMNSPDVDERTEPLPENPEDDWIDGIERKRRLALIRSALGSLHPRERRAIELYFGLEWAGILTEDRTAIGRILGITPQAVSKHLHNGLVRIRKNLGVQAVQGVASV